MLMSTLLASGFYAGITIMPMLGGSTLPGAARPAPITLVQAHGGGGLVEDSKIEGQTGFVPFPAQAQFETGDTWVSGGRRYRLYGLQTCLRGTSVTISPGAVRDCGQLNLIMAQAMIRDTRPVCTTIRNIDQNNAVVACQTTTGERRYDLATYMIAHGWGFAAIDDTGQLIVPGYRVAEESARSARAGLWAYSDMPHPIPVLTKNARAQR
ncbi:thermonuclease family protein [Rhizobium sp. L80/93]|uniref:thermonuclease family protein n=2 Tax=unclassified Rhizobium TaxID=2613769 RepID=UPI001AD976F6|nr:MULTISPECIES: thermonuclease family protein [unclassified Rhizobium]MBO9135306.1 thermonuclease family protein [Rhizobium sp. B209b/85]MBO9171535.1 thermonuclease family protein [Rhizobium sp. L245/93]MBO9187401.1 thermonuclease family protein [Rhizobium sp. E27B/91]QXZ98887.1 thermonuclease family protein [Rhizobium sp. B230/85]